MQAKPGHIREPLPDRLCDGLSVVFVAFPRQEEDAEAVHHYADPHERFWDLVNEAGLVSDLVGAENDHLVLDEKCGLTILTKKEASAAVDIEAFIGKMEKFKPKVVAFNGGNAYHAVFKRDSRDFGLMDDIIGDSYVFVLPSSSEKDTSIAYQKKLHWYKKLKATIETL